MHHETPAESAALSSVRPPAHARLEMLDVAAAIAAAEGATGSRVFQDSADGDLASLIAEASALTARSERTAVVAPVERLASVRESLRRVATTRRGTVVHALSGHGAEELAALTDLGWGVLCASGPEDSFDLTLIARRAAEDCGVPFIVVHALGRPQHPAGRGIAMVALPQTKALETFVGHGVHARPKSEGARASAGDRTFAERVPFALGAALREYGVVSGRRHDTFDKIPLGESPLVLLGVGAVGDALFCATNQLRARGYDVGAVHVTALRPFPGQRLVKALARALAITVLEPVDEPLAHGALLARDLKAAFCDALTWMPGFPGIGRMPKLFVGATGPAFDVADLAAACDNMLADERGRRTFSFIDGEHALPRARLERGTPEGSTREVAIRFVLDDAAAADAVLGAVGTALIGTLGLRSHGIVTAGTPGEGAVLDLVASRDHARGGMARRKPRLVLATEKGAGRAGAVAPLTAGAVLGVLAADSSAALPEAARIVVRERRARVLTLPGDGTSEALVACATGAALAVASRALGSPLEPAAVVRVTGEVIAGDGPDLHKRAVHAFETTGEALEAAATAAEHSGPVSVT